MESEIRKVVSKAVGEATSQLDRRFDSTKKNLELEVGRVKDDIGSLKKDIEDIKARGKFDPEILDKGVKFVRLVSPDYWSVSVGPVSVSLHGFNDVSETATKKLIEDIKRGEWPEALKPFLVAVAPTSIDITLEASFLTTVARAGISWGYSNPAERIEEIIGLIKKLN